MCRTPMLVLAVISGDLLKVKSLVKQGHSVNATDEKGATALHWACCKNSENICEYLIEAGCSVNATIKYGSTALHVTADRGCTGCARILIQSGADLDSTNERLDTPLHTAAYRGHLDIIQMLIHAGASPLLRNNHGLTPLEEASARNFDKCVQYLLPFNTNIHKQQTDKHCELSKVSYIHEQQTSSLQCKLGSANSSVQSRLGTSHSSKLNVSTISGSDEIKRIDDRSMSISSSEISSIDSDYCSYTSAKGSAMFVDTLEATCEDYNPSFRSLYNKAVTVKSQTGSPVSRGPGKERHSSETETADEVFQSSVPPALPPRPLWLCSPQLAHRLSPFENVRHRIMETDTRGDKLIGLELNQFIEQLQLRMVEMQDKLVNYETCNTQLKNEVRILKDENAKLTADKVKLQRLHYEAQSQQLNIYHEGVSELDEGVHSGSFRTNQSTGKLNDLNSVTSSSSIFYSERSREPVESNELVYK